MAINGIENMFLLLLFFQGGKSVGLNSFPFTFRVTRILLLAFTSRVQFPNSANNYCRVLYLPLPQSLAIAHLGDVLVSY